MKQIQPVDVAMASPAVASPVKDDFESNLDLELEKLDSGPLDQEESQSGISSREKSPTGNGVSGSTNQDQHEDSPINGNVSDNNDEESNDIQEEPKSNEGEEKTANTDEGEDNDGEEMDDDDDEDDIGDEDDEDQDVDSLLKEVSELVDSDSDSKDETRNTQARPPPNLEEDEEDEAAMLLLEDSQSPQAAPMDIDDATTSQLLEDDDDMTSDFVAAEADLGETLDLNSDTTSPVENTEVSNNSTANKCKTDEGKTEKSEELSIQVEKPCTTVETESKSVTEVKQKEAMPDAAALEEASGLADSQSSTDPTSKDSQPSTKIEESSKVTTSEQGTNDDADSELRDQPPKLTTTMTNTKLAEDGVETPNAEVLDRSPKSKSEDVAKGGHNESKPLEEKDIIDDVIDDNKQEPTSVNEDAKPDILSSVNDKITNTEATKISEPMEVSAVNDTADLKSKENASTFSKEGEEKDESIVSPPTNELQTKDDEDGKTNGTAFLDEALDALHGIAQSNRKLLDDESPTKRPRALDTDSEEPIVPAKKVKISDTEEIAKLRNDDEETPAKAVKKLKKVVKRMSRTEIEDLVTEIMVEVLSGRSEIGKLRQKCDSYDENLELWKRKATALQKQCQDLNTVMRKYITDVKNRPQDKFTPIKITRSVGLQVVGDRKRLSVNGAPTSVIKMTPLQQMGATKKAPQSSNVSSPLEANNPNSPIVVPGVSNPKVPMRYPLPQNTGGSNILTLRKVPVIGSSNPGPKSKTTTTVSTNAPKSLLQPVGTKIAVPNTLALTTGSQNNVPQKPPPTKATKAPNDVIDIVDLSDEDEKTTPSSTVNKPIGLVPINRLQKPQASRQNGPPMMANRSLSNQPPSLFSFSGHPAPLPTLPLSQYKMKNQPGFKATPPKPSLKISKLKSGIVLSWNMDLMPTLHADITFYQIFAYQEGNAAPSPSLWKKVGDVRALPLPMACTLTQFQKGHKYHFAVRALDTHQRLGNFSDPQSIQLS